VGLRLKKEERPGPQRCVAVAALLDARHAVREEEPCAGCPRASPRRRDPAAGRRRKPRTATREHEAGGPARVTMPSCRCGVRSPTGPT
jgi:hypothetical protein